MLLVLRVYGVDETKMRVTPWAASDLFRQL